MATLFTEYHRSRFLIFFFFFFSYVSILTITPYVLFRIKESSQAKCRAEVSSSYGIFTASHFCFDYRLQRAEKRPCLLLRC